MHRRAMGGTVETRHLDFEIALTRAQWEELGRTAEEAGAEEGGLDWSEEDPDAIHVRMHRDDAPAGWRDWMSDEGKYGDTSPEVARFRFNDGRPFAEVDPPLQPVPPNVIEPEEAALQKTLEEWIRAKWHGLVRESGLHYERGHLPQD